MAGLLGRTRRPDPVRRQHDRARQARRQGFRRLKTWQGDQWKIGGGGTWGWYSYDPQLNLIYYGSGNPSTWNPVQRPGDNKWSMTIFARNPDTGVAKWVYQMTPHDQWDYDGVNEMILADINVKGQPTKALVHFDRNGFGYTLNRETGALLVAEKYRSQGQLGDARSICRPAGHRSSAELRQARRGGQELQGYLPSGSRLQRPTAGGLLAEDWAFLRADEPRLHGLRAVQGVVAAGQPYVGATLSMFRRRATTTSATSSPGTPAPARSCGPDPEPFSVWSGASPQRVTWSSTARSRAT